MLGSPISSRRSAWAALMICLLFCLPVGAGMAFLSAFDRIVRSAVPYPEAERIFRLRQAHPTIPDGSGNFSPAQVHLLRERLQSFDAVVGYRSTTVRLRSRGVSQSVQMAIASPEYLSLLTGAPASRASVSSPTGGDAEGVWFSPELWARRFGELAPDQAPPFFVDDVSRPALGILPDIPLYPVESDLLLLEEPQVGEKYDTRSFFVAVLVKVDAETHPHRLAELDTVKSSLARLAGIAESDLDRYELSHEILSEDLSGDAAGLLLLLQSCAWGLLGLGAFNSWSVWSSLLSRERDGLVTRMALGADPVGIRRGYLLSAFGTMLIATACGAGFALVLIPPLQDLLMPLSARYSEVALSLFSVLSVGGATWLLGTLAAASAWRTAGLSAGMVLRSKGRASSKSPNWQWPALAAQGAVCTALLLVGLGASQRLQDRQGADLGFEPGEVEMVEVSLPEPPYDDQEKVLALVERIRDAPSLSRQSLAVATSAPLAGEYVHAWMARAEVPGYDQPLETVIPTRLVSSNYFSMVGARFRNGEGFPDRIPRDQEEVPVVANLALVEEYWPGSESPLGRRFFARRKTFRIIGVIDNIRETTLEETRKPMLYLPYSMRPASTLVFMWRRGSAEKLSPQQFPSFLRSFESNALIVESNSLAARYRNALFLELAMSSLFGVMAVFALVMYSLGIAAHLVQSSRARARSMAIRAALGGTPLRLFRSLVAGTLIAVTVGILGGAGLFRWLAGLGFDLPTESGVSWHLVTAMLLLQGTVLVVGTYSLFSLALHRPRHHLGTGD